MSARERLRKLALTPQYFLVAARNHAFDPAEALANTDELSAALAQLGPEDREPLRLKFAEGLSTAEIAIAMASSYDAMAKRLPRALARLREIIQRLRGQ